MPLTAADRASFMFAVTKASQSKLETRAAKAATASVLASHRTAELAEPQRGPERGLDRCRVLQRSSK